MLRTDSDDLHNNLKRLICNGEAEFFYDIRNECLNSTTSLNCVKKNELDAQLFLSIFRQPLHVSGISRPIIRRYNRMCTTVGTYNSF